MSAKRLGLYLGVQPSAGGMFQYAQCVLKSLAYLKEQKSVDVVVAYGDQRWAAIIEQFCLPSVALRYWAVGTFMARILMALRVPASSSRLVSLRANPVVRALRGLERDLWIFPAQDELSWQVGGDVVGTIHDLMHRYESRFPESGNWWRRSIREHRFRNIASQSTAILVDSNMGKQHVLESYASCPEKIHVLPYIAPDYILEGRERSDFDSYYQLPAKFYFYPAQFWRHKNHGRLIDALGEARRICSDMALVLSGGFKHEYESVRQQVSEAGLTDAVWFVGYVPDTDMAGFYSRARGLVMPTFFGPTNIPPLEAMATGCPVLISEIYAMPEQCGGAALYFNPNSVEEIRDQMIKLWTDDRLYGLLSENGLMRTAAWGQLDFEKRLAEILKGLLAKQ